MLTKVDLTLDDGTTWADAPYSMYDWGSTEIGIKIYQRINKHWGFWIRSEEFIEVEHPSPSQTIIRRI